MAFLVFFVPRSPEGKCQFYKFGQTKKNIQLTELELIIDLHRNSERQGPGSDGETLKALGFMDLPTHRKLKVADIGCGSGGQTMVLAGKLNAHITAIDLFPAFLEELDLKAQRAELQDKIDTVEASMDDLPFDDEELDIIWAEGAIYNMGFENGIKSWKRHLKKGGYLAVSEITWISLSRPSELERFWKGEYPEIDLASSKIRLLEENGYTLAGYFYLGQDSWIKNYYKPLEEKFEKFLERHGHSELATKVINDNRTEMDLYKNYKAHYSYGFYIARKN